jgi:hypothetical protein
MRAARLAPLLATLALAACGANVDYTAVDATSTPAPAHAKQPKPPRTKRARCPRGIAGCVSVTGPVLFVEATDPDGDGDAHYVLSAGHVTASGLTVLKIVKAKRPKRLARPGDIVSAAGTITVGSRAERQLSVLVLHQPRR